MPFIRREAPSAHDKLDAIDTIPNPPGSPFTRFTPCWMAFNDIYGIITRKALSRTPNAPRHLRTERKQQICS